MTDGYAAAAFTDTLTRLNVQPLTPNDLKALPEGDRTVKRIKSFGPDRLTSADEWGGVPGDRLFYHGHWYECVSCVQWHHTILAHFRSNFVICKEQDDPPLLSGPEDIPDGPPEEGEENDPEGT
jgi:hypothetical protein